MESLVIAAAIIKRESIMDTITYMEPFLNIQENEGILYYRLIIILKIMFANYSTITCLPKAGTLAFLNLLNGYIIFTDPYEPIRWIVGIVLFLSDIYYSLGKSGRLETSTVLMCCLALNLKHYEFLIDMYVLYCVAFYACQTYSREYQKLATLTMLMLAIGWCLSTGIRPGKVKDAVIFLSFLFVVYYPLIPNPTTKFRHRLLYFYAVMLLWVLYKIHQNSAMKMNIADGDPSVKNDEVNLKVYAGQENGVPLPSTIVAEIGQTD